MRVISRFSLLAIAIALCGFWESKESRYRRGYQDGYAVGFNTACQIRATIIKGDWNDQEYSRGYSDGTTAGIVACNNSRKTN